MNTYNAILIIGFFALVFVPVVIILWRNVRLTQPWKGIFCLSVAPIFFIAMMVNIALVDEYLPFLFDLLGRAQDSDKLLTEPLIGFLIATPLASLTAVAWYLLLRIPGRAPHGLA